MDTITVVLIATLIFIVGFLSCFYWLLFTPYSIDRLGPEGMDYPEPTPNKVFLERYGDRRRPDQSWGEQVNRAFMVKPVSKPVLLKRVK